MCEELSVHQRVLELAAAMTLPTEQEKPMLEALCTAAEAMAAQRLKEGLTPADCGCTYLCAAAMLAAAGLLPCRESGGVEQFTAGDVTIRTGGGDGCAEGAALRRQAACLMAGYWEDDGFAFVGVKG